MEQRLDVAGPLAVSILTHFEPRFPHRGQAAVMSQLRKSSLTPSQLSRKDTAPSQEGICVARENHRFRRSGP
jgi:hypothetical protein